MILIDVRCCLLAVFNQFNDMLDGFGVGVDKRTGMLGTDAFEFFPEDLHVFGSPAFVMAGGITNFHMVMHSFDKFFIRIGEIAEMEEIKDLKHQLVLFLNPHMAEVIAVVGELAPGRHVGRHLVLVQVCREPQGIFL